MRWKRGDKCIFNDAVMRRVLKPVCAESSRDSRDPGLYFVVAVNEEQTVAIVVGRENRLIGVLTEWLIPYIEPVWSEIRRAIFESATPTGLVRRLRLIGDSETHDK